MPAASTVTVSQPSTASTSQCKQCNRTALTMYCQRATSALHTTKPAAVNVRTALPALPSKLTKDLPANHRRCHARITGRRSISPCSNMMSGSQLAGHTESLSLRLPIAVCEGGGWPWFVSSRDSFDCRGATGSVHGALGAHKA